MAAQVCRTQKDGPMRAVKTHGVRVALAMSRSIGDHAMKGSGVIADPVVTTTELTAAARCLVRHVAPRTGELVVVLILLPWCSADAWLGFAPAVALPRVRFPCRFGIS